MNHDIKTLRERLQQLEKLHKEGAVGRKAYETGKAQLERDILAAVLAAPAGAAAAPRPSRSLSVGVLSFVVVLAVAGYAVTGSPGVPSAGPPGTQAAGAAGNPHAGGADEQAQFVAAVEQLAKRLESQPDDADGWATLARSYGMMGRIDEALPAYAKAVSLHGGDARLLADYADMLALKNNRNIEGEPLKLVERALKIDPRNLKALSLAGAAAFNRQDYAGAVAYWDQVAQYAPPDSPFLPQVQASIAEARERGGLGLAAIASGQAAQAPAAAKPAATATPAPVTAPATTSTAATANAATTTAAPAAAASIRGTVRIAPALAQMAGPNDAVFIYARPAEGSRMPLAILRKQVKDLPAEFTLDDSMAMSPGAKLSLFPKVVVSVRVSKSGQAMAAAGDLTGESAAVGPTTAGLMIEINEVVKN